MKIVYINETCGTGSIGKLTLDLATEMRNRGNEVYFYYSKETTDSYASTQIGNKVFRNIHAVFSRITGLQGYFSYVPTLKLILRLRKISPDIIHLQNLHANYINLCLLFNYIKRYKISTVVTLHDCWFYTGKCTYYVPANCEKWQKECGNCPLLHKDNVNPTLFFDMTKKCLRDKKKWLLGIEKLAVIGVSEWVTNEAAQSFLSVRNPLTIKNWIDQSIFYPKKSDTLRSHLGLEDKFVVLMVSSRISRIKGYDILIHLAKVLDVSYQIVVIGKNSDNLLIPNNVIHIPYTRSITDLAEYYSMADVCVNTTKYETFGMVTAEALCCGTPVIVFNNTASPELISDGCGYVIDEQNYAKEIVAALAKVKENGKTSYSKKCIEVANSKFSKKNGIDSYVKLYEELVQMESGEG